MPVRVGLQYIEQWKDSMENAVRKYEDEAAPCDQIVFYGPSYYTRWSEEWGNTPLRRVLLGKSGAECCLNRGFGSSCPEHQLYYYHRMIRPLAPVCWFTEAGETVKPLDTVMKRRLSLLNAW